MLVFRNQTAYNRFWDGRNNLTTILTGIRNLARTILVCSHDRDLKTQWPKPLSPAEKLDIERIIKVLIAIPYAVKNHLRAEWGVSIVPGTALDQEGLPTFNPEYSDLLPKALRGYEDQGLGLPLQLTFFVEAFIKRGFDRGWYHGPQASQLQVQLNTMTDAYGRMETITGTPIPIAHLYGPYPHPLPLPEFPPILSYSNPRLI
jgi:ion channel-forming bestrophin family protein